MQPVGLPRKLPDIAWLLTLRDDFSIRARVRATSKYFYATKLEIISHSLFLKREDLSSANEQKKGREDEGE